MSADKTTEDIQSYCSTFIPYCWLETNLVIALLLLLWHSLIPWHTITVFIRL